MSAPIQIFSNVRQLKDASKLASAKFLYVDNVNYAATPVRGRIESPYQTIAAAEAAASSGDTIIVRTVQVNEKNLGKTGVDYIFEPGSGITYTEVLTTTTSAITMFDLVGKVCNITGHGEFSMTITEDVEGAGGTPTVAFFKVGASSFVTIEAQSTDDSGSGLDSGGTFDAILQAGGTIFSCRIVSTGSIEISGGTANLEFYSGSLNITGGTVYVLAQTATSVSITSGTHYITASSIGSLAVSGGTSHVNVGLLTTGTHSTGNLYLTADQINTFTRTGASGFGSYKAKQWGTIGQTSVGVTFQGTGTSRTEVEGGYAEWGTQTGNSPPFYPQSGAVVIRDVHIRDLGTSDLNLNVVIYGELTGVPTLDLTLENLKVYQSRASHGGLKMHAQMNIASKIRVIGGSYVAGSSGYWADFEAVANPLRTIEIHGIVNVSQSGGAGVLYSGPGAVVKNTALTI